jgi:hypothetical protein
MRPGLALAKARNFTIPAVKSKQVPVVLFEKSRDQVAQGQVK